MNKLLKGHKRIYTNEYEKLYRIFPTIWGIDVGAVFKQTVGDVDPAVESSDVERSTVVVISGLH